MIFFLQDITFISGPTFDQIHNFTGSDALHTDPSPISHDLSTDHQYFILQPASPAITSRSRQLDYSLSGGYEDEDSNKYFVLENFPAILTCPRDKDDYDNARPHACTGEPSTSGLTSRDRDDEDMRILGYTRIWDVKRSGPNERISKVWHTVDVESHCDTHVLSAKFIQSLQGIAPSDIYTCKKTNRLSRRFTLIPADGPKFVFSINIFFVLIQ